MFNIYRERMLPVGALDSWLIQFISGRRTFSLVDPLCVAGRFQLPAEAAGIDLGQLRSKKQNLGRVVNPKQDDDRRTRRAISGGNGAFPQVHSEQGFSHREQQGRNGCPHPHFAPGNLHVGQDLVNHREQEGDDAQ